MIPSYLPLNLQYGTVARIGIEPGHLGRNLKFEIGTGWPGIDENVSVLRQFTQVLFEHAHKIVL